MNILMLKSYYFPESAASLYLTENLIEDLAAYGYETTLIVPLPSRGVSEKVKKEYKQKKYEEQFKGKVKIHRFWMFPEKRNPIGRALRYFLCNIAHFFKGLFFSNINIIYVGSTPPTQGLLAAFLKKIKKVPFVYSLQDIFPDSLVNSNITKSNSVLYNIGRKIEKYTYKNADKIIVISEDFRQNLLSKGVPEDKIEIVYNWVDENAIIPLRREDNPIFDSLNISRNKFYIVYAGNLGHAQNIEVILKSAKELITFQDIQFIIFGGGAQEQYYKDMVRDMGLENVSFYPLQPYSMVSQVYSLSDASIVTCKKGLGKSAMPSKTWSIMSAERAVIANFDEGTDLQNIIEQSSAGIFTKAGDFMALKDAIIKLYQNKSLCEEMGKNGRNFILSNLTRKIGTQKYIDTIRSVVG